MLAPRSARREQLGDFLSARRGALLRAAAGLPTSPRRREAGLSREEVAILAGVSVSWYTWLEQGREINVSRQVLAAVARVLQLTDDETEYMFALSEPERETAATESESVPEHLKRLIDSLRFPAFVLATDWSIVGWNAPYEWLYPSIATLPEADRNLLWLIYTDPQLRKLLPDWSRTSRSFLADFRAEAGVRLNTPRHRALIARLEEASPEFRRQWAVHVVERFASRIRSFQHPDAGLVRFEHNALVPADVPGLTVVTYVPVG